MTYVAISVKGWWFEYICSRRNFDEELTELSNNVPLVHLRFVDYYG
jgi:hypothetical protein